MSFGYNYEKEILRLGEYDPRGVIGALKDAHKEYLKVVDNLNNFWKDNSVINREQMIKGHSGSNWESMMLADVIMIEQEQIEKVYSSPRASNYDLYVFTSKVYEIEPLDQFDFITLMQSLKEKYKGEEN